MRWNAIYLECCLVLGAGIYNINLAPDAKISFPPLVFGPEEIEREKSDKNNDEIEPCES